MHRIRVVCLPPDNIPMSTLQSALKSQKRALRGVLSTKLASLPLRNVQEQSHVVIGRLASLPAFQRARSVSCYLSMPSGEVDTSFLVSDILDSDKTLFVPKIISKSGEMDYLKLYSKDDLDNLPSGTWGIKEPQFDWRGEPRLKALDFPDFDLILLPAVAFDKSFARLGHGKGFYDRFINSYLTRHQRRPFLVGLALREQLLESGQIPMGDYDWSMDVIITPNEILINSLAASGHAPQTEVVVPGQ